jgi:hypothetical protein
MVPPGIPNTASQPTASSESTSDCAPVTCVGSLTARRAAEGRVGGGVGFGGPGTGAGRGIAVPALVPLPLVIWALPRVCSVGCDVGSDVGRYSGNKKPSPPGSAERGLRVDSDFSGVDAPEKYDLDE